MAEFIKGELDQFDYSFLGNDTTPGPITNSVCGSVGQFVSGSTSYLGGPVGNVIRKKYGKFQEALSQGQTLSTELFDKINTIINNIKAIFDKSVYGVTSLDLSLKEQIITQKAQAKKDWEDAVAKYNEWVTVTVTDEDSNEESEVSVQLYHTAEQKEVIDAAELAFKKVEELVNLLEELEIEVANAKVAISEMNEKINIFKSTVSSITPSYNTYFLADESLFKANTVSNPSAVESKSRVTPGSISKGMVNPA